MKIIIIFSLIGVGLVLTGCGQKSTSENQTLNQTINQNIDSSTNTNQEITTISQESATESSNNVNVRINAPVTTTVDCRSSDCFQEKFSKCEKATLKASVLGAEYYYEIIGLENNKCKMLTRYNKNPNPDWVGKNMICLYDNSLNFEEANKSVLNGIIEGSVICNGELFQILSSLAN